jgi:peptidyl-Lys metalloendopeptidase
VMSLVWSNASYAGYTGCNPEQQAFASAAINEALNLTNGAYTNLSTTPLPNPTYSEWFGNSTPQRKSVVEGHFGALKAHLLIGVLSITCGCTDQAEKNKVRAYALFKEPYKVFLCTGFFATHKDPKDGFDTRGGIMLHEVSHFEIVNDNVDGKPGLNAARERAANDPDAAIRTADNHHFFAEAVAGAK